MKLENVKIAELTPLEKNVRLHPETQIKELMRSLDQFGQTRALVVDEKNTILVGNGIYEAMKRSGYDECSVYRVTGLSEKQKKKLVVSDNKTFKLGLDDFDNLQAYIDEIAAENDFDIAGFDEEAIKELTRTAKEVEKDVMRYGIVEQPVAAAPQREPQNAADERNSNQPPEYPAKNDLPHREPVGAAENIPEHTSVETTRKVICPSCGEVIYID